MSLLNDVKSLISSSKRPLKVQYSTITLAGTTNLIGTEVLKSTSTLTSTTTYTTNTNTITTITSAMAMATTTTTATATATATTATAMMTGSTITAVAKTKYKLIEKQTQVNIDQQSRRIDNHLTHIIKLLQQDE